MIDVSHCVGRSKGKPGKQVKSVPERRDRSEIYPRSYAHNWWINL